jgi:hypothetical protein
MARSRCRRFLAVLMLAVFALSAALPALARDRDDPAAAREANANRTSRVDMRQVPEAKAAGSSERQSAAALRLGLKLLRGVTQQLAVNQRTPASGLAAPAAPAAAAAAAAADLAEAEKLFRELVAAGGHAADEGEAGLIAIMLVRGSEGAADANAEIRRLQQSGRGTDVLLCMAMRDLMHPGAGRVGGLAANDEINDRIHAVFPTAPYLVSGRVSKPEELSAPRLKLSEQARQNQLRGSVVMEAVLDREGHVADVLVLKPGPFSLADSATKVVRQSIYSPALLDGKPVPACLQPVVSVDFQQ